MQRCRYEQAETGGGLCCPMFKVTLWLSIGRVRKAEGLNWLHFVDSPKGTGL
jgi:hypothetical protein